MNKTPKKIGMVSLGCPKNLVDSEAVLGDLKISGYEVTPDESQADVIIVNTCGFLQSAVKESIDTILEMAGHKSTGRCQQLIVTGCLAERNPDELLKEIPEIDHLLGTKQYPMLKHLLNGSEQSKQRNHVNEPAQYFENYDARAVTTPFYSAYVKIAEGCSNKCAFCIIPKLRGPIQSRPVESIVDEAKQLAERGVREINLVSQDTTLYGYDLGMKRGLIQLLEQLAEVEGVDWIRLFYNYPTVLTTELMDAVQSIDKVVKYIDVPLQHTHNFMLKHMKRQETEAGVRQMIDQLRQRIPGVALRTTFITGFPGETEEHFQHLLDFVKEVEFDHVGVFAYSDEPGTAAFDYADKVAPEVGEARRDEVMAAQRDIVLRKNQERVGQTHPALVEGLDTEDGILMLGRLPFQGPDVDGQVILEQCDAEPGDIIPVRITGAFEYDLVASPEDTN
ncbi:MAG: 30S ribosomal protein S12 methylthiotransferase RimO [Nitrospinota bacterium]|nr:30S ribosomal protein S12 methylthiotransferase RimO [Nitrospinota bacterium]